MGQSPVPDPLELYTAYLAARFSDNAHICTSAFSDEVGNLDVTTDFGRARASAGTPATSITSIRLRAGCLRLLRLRRTRASAGASARRGDQTRDFTYVGSVVSVLSDAVTRRVTAPEPVNLALASELPC